MYIELKNINKNYDRNILSNISYKFESGKNSLTSQIINKDKKVIVVGKDGIGYDKEHWDSSNTFWISEQENLLISDNQTRAYVNGDSEKKSYFSRIAWGRKN